MSNMSDLSDLSDLQHGHAAWELWQAVREKKPLVQCITNFVSMDLMANTLLAAGAAPAMAHCIDEVEEFLQIASALVVNVGTLSPDWVAAMHLAANVANSLHKPWVLDPVGAGATSFRTQTIISLLELRPTLVRGNASEIMALAGATGTTRGVDSSANPSDALLHGKQLAQKYRTIVAISGKIDLVTDGQRVLAVSGGVEMLTSITATGCAVTALAIAFVAAASDLHPATVLASTAYALATFGYASEVASREAQGPASLRIGLLDELYVTGRSTDPDIEDDYMGYIEIKQC